MQSTKKIVLTFSERIHIYFIFYLGRNKFGEIPISNVVHWQNVSKVDLIDWLFGSYITAVYDWKQSLKLHYVISYIFFDKFIKSH